MTSAHSKGTLRRGGVCPAVAALALLVAAPAFAQDADRPSEDDMFGGSSTTTDEGAPAQDAPAEGGSSRDEQIFGGGAPASIEHPDILAREENALDIGGQVFLRLNDTWRNKDSVGDTQLSSPSLADVFADVRPNDRVRGFGQVRLNYDFTVQPGQTDLFGNEQKQFDLQLDQLWIKFDLGRVAYVTAGRQHIRWGTGRFWNPTDFINTEVRDSVDFFDTRLGVNLIKVHFPFEALGWNLYLLGVFDGVDVLNDSGVAARAEFVVGPGEIALSSLVKKDAPLRFGFDASAGIWLFDVRAEGTVQRGLDQKKFEGTLDFANGKVPTEVAGTDDQWFARGVVGADLQLKYSDEDSILIGGEYFYNQAGYSNAKLYPFLALNGAFTPFYLGQHYFGAYVSLPSPLSFNDTSITVSTLGNLSDGSYLSRLDVQQLFLTNLTVNVFGAVHWGNPGEMKLGVDIPAVPTIPALANGLTIEPPIVDVGAALRVSL